jgi:hypothetical protein
MDGRRPFVWEFAPAAELFRPKTRAEEEEARAEPQAASPSPSAARPAVKSSDRTKSQPAAAAWSVAWSKANAPAQRAALTAFLQPRAPPMLGDPDADVASRQVGPPPVWPPAIQSMQFARPPPWRETRERKERRKPRAPPKALGGPAGINRR